MPFDSAPVDGYSTRSPSAVDGVEAHVVGAGGDLPQGVDGLGDVAADVALGLELAQAGGQLVDGERRAEPVEDPGRRARVVAVVGERCGTSRRRAVRASTVPVVANGPGGVDRDRAPAVDDAGAEADRRAVALADLADAHHEAQLAVGAAPTGRVPGPPTGCTARRPRRSTRG